MNLSKLELMSTDALQAIRDKCAEVLKSRAGLALRIGTVAWFCDTKGARRFMRITRVNQKTLSGIEVDPVSHFQIGKSSWKVGPSLLNPVVDKERETKALDAAKLKLAREQKAAATAIVADKPVEAYGEAW